jgi:hypothetical protein
MNKMQFSAMFNDRGSALRQSINAWGTRPVSLEDTKFFRSWLVYDSDLETNRTRGRINWNLIVGAALMLAVSAGGWAGVAWLVSRLWK